MKSITYNIRLRRARATTAKTPGWLFLAVTAGFLAFFTPISWADNPGEIHYPDLQARPAYDLRIERSGKTKLLRFSTTIANRGEGPLGVFADNNEENGTTDAYQILYSHDEGGNSFVADVAFVGTFEFHSAHNHWHFEDFALYELRNVTRDGSIGSRILSGRKVSFCIMDTTVDDLSLEHAGARTYVECGLDVPQGISVGWADTYPWWLPDQDLDISDVKNGDYWLVIVADPNDLLDEGGGVREINNASAVKIRLRGNSVSVIE